MRDPEEYQAEIKDISDELTRLRSVNAQMLEALKAVITTIRRHEPTFVASGESPIGRALAAIAAAEAKE